MRRARPSNRRLADSAIKLLDRQERAATTGHAWLASLCGHQARRALAELDGRAVEQAVPVGLHKNTTERIQ